jgi:hypothetical protein
MQNFFFSWSDIAEPIEIKFKNPTIIKIKNKASKM